MAKKILFLNHNYENFGTYFRCFNLAKHLSFLGFDLTLICASKKNFDLKIRIKPINENFRVITLPRIKVHEYHTGHLLRAFIGCFIVLLRRYDTLHSFAVAQPATGIPTLVCRFFKRKPIIVDWDDDWTDGLGKYHPYPVWKTISILEKKVPMSADAITVVSEYLKDKCLQNGYSSLKIFKIPNGSDIDAIKPMDRDKARKYLKIETHEQIVLSMGHTYMKSMDFLLQAYEKVRESRPQARLYLVGRIGLAMNRIKGKFPDLMGHLVCAGEQPFEKIPYYLGAADVLVLPMEDSPMEQSRFPIRLGDYLASGRPIVSNAAGEVKSVLEAEGCGLTCDSGDFISFARNTIQLLEDPKLQNELGGKARLAAENRYSWSKIAFDLADIDSRLTRSPKP